MFTNLPQKISALKKYWFNISYFGNFEKIHIIFEYKSFKDFKLHLFNHDEYTKYILNSMGEYTDIRLLIRDVLVKARDCVFVIFDTPEGYVQFWLAQGKLEVSWFLDIYDKDKWKKDKKIIVAVLKELNVPECINTRTTKNFETYYATFYINKECLANEDGSEITENVPSFQVNFNTDYETASRFVVGVLERVYNLKSIDELSIELG